MRPNHIPVILLLVACGGGGNGNGAGDGGGPGPVEWAIGLGGAHTAFGVASGADGTATVAGNFSSTISIGQTTLTSAGSTDAMVVRLNSGGEPVWAASGGGPMEDDAYAIAAGAEGSTYVSGTCSERATFGATTLECDAVIDAFVAKLDKDGKFVWATRFGGSGPDRGHALAVSDDDVYVVGSFDGSAAFGDATLVSNGDWDGFVAKLDPNTGSVTWAKKIGGTGTEAAAAVAASPAGVFVAGMMQGTVTLDGNTITAAGQTDAFVAKLSPSGDAEWLVRGGGANADYGNALAIDPAGGVFFAAGFETTAMFGSHRVSGGRSTLAIVSLDDAGSFRWASAPGGEGRSSAAALAVLGDGHLLVAGDYEDDMTMGPSMLTSTNSSQDVFLTRVAPDGTIGPTLTGGSPGDDTGLDVAVGADGEITVVGNIGGTAQFQSNTLPGSEQMEAFAWRTPSP